MRFARTTDMYCQHCGKKIAVSSTFCTYCGKRVTLTTTKPRSQYLDISDDISLAEEHEEFAGFWVRFGAYIVDLLGVIGVAFALAMMLYILFEEKVVDAWLDGFAANIFGYICYVIYNTCSLGLWSTTLGKHLYGLIVTTEGSDEPLTLGTALKRSLLQPLSTLFFGAGYWNMDKNEQKQAWHDTSAKTLVLQKKRDLTLAYIFTIIALIIWAVFAAMSE